MLILDKYNGELEDLFDQVGLKSSTISTGAIPGLAKDIGELFLLHNFGGCAGLILVPSAAGFNLSQLDLIWEAGFGCSVVDFSGDETRADLIDVLTDWGWTGPSDEKPAWLVYD
ncbi:hypothetical protein [Hyphomonas atlantica]|nr:hypothetical protein [Hyphomonas atlantica]